MDEDNLSTEEKKERAIMKLLLKIKNGDPHQRKMSMRTIADKAREFGAAALFNQILPLLMSRALEDQERHLLVKIVDRVLYKLDDLVGGCVCVRTLTRAGLGAPLRAQDPRGHLPPAHRRGLLREGGGKGDHLQPLQGRRAGHHDPRHAPGHR